jgi:hypothetical protein
VITFEIIDPGANDPGGPPFTIVIIANVALEAPWNSGRVLADGVLSNRATFNRCVQYIVDALHGRLPGAIEPLLSAPPLLGRTRILSIFDPSLPVALSNSFVGLDAQSSLLVARRDEIGAFLRTHGLVGDVVYAITEGDALHSRASAWFTTDDLPNGGVQFTFDGVALTHCFGAFIPGTIAMHVNASGPTAAHEFCHAISSYQNGSIVDLYANSSLGINNKHGRPIPATFASLNGSSHQSDASRDHIGYPASWQSYHCALHDLARPALMDNYHLTSIPLACPNDTITRQFIMDRLVVKTTRP